LALPPKAFLIFLVLHAISEIYVDLRIVNKLHWRHNAYKEKLIDFDGRRHIMKKLKIKQLFLAGIIALSLILGGVGIANKIQAVNPPQPQQMAGPCWRCGG
jgi:hypothetical protein